VLVMKPIGDRMQQTGAKKYVFAGEKNGGLVSCDSMFVTMTWRCCNTAVGGTFRSLIRFPAPPGKKKHSRWPGSVKHSNKNHLYHQYNAQSILRTPAFTQIKKVDTKKYP